VKRIVIAIKKTVPEVVLISLCHICPKYVMKSVVFSCRKKCENLYTNTMSSQ
jgi:hypothetical protein